MAGEEVVPWRQLQSKEKPRDKKARQEFGVIRVDKPLGMEEALPAWSILDLSASENWVLLKKCKLIVILANTKYNSEDIFFCS